MTQIKRFASLFLLIAMPLIVPFTYAVEAEETAPVIKLPRLQEQAAGEITSIADYKGKLIYLDFWASWCGPCRQSFPVLQKIRTQYADQGFEVIAVNLDTELAPALKFLNQFPVDYPILLDPQYTMANTYGIQGLPTAYLINHEGTVIYKHLGFKKTDEKWLTALIEQHLPRL